MWIVLALASIAWAEDAGYQSTHERWRRSQADAAFHEGGHLRGTPGYRYAGSRRHHHKPPEPVIIEPRERVYGYVYEDRRLSGPEVEGRRRVQIDVMSNVQRLPVIEAASNEQHNLKDACVDAIKSWKASVRFKYGERFSQWKDAVQAERQCVQSSLAQTLTARAADAAGRFVGMENASALYRCEVRAEPRQSASCYLTGDAWECAAAEKEDDIARVCK